MGVDRPDEENPNWKRSGLRVGNGSPKHGNQWEKYQG